jgi:hypothetical protein
MTQPAASVSQIAKDTRLTKKVPAGESVVLVCKTHTAKHWATDNRSGAPIHFTGEMGKQNHHGLIVPFKQAVREIVSGKALKRDQPIEFTPNDLQAVAESYILWEEQYAFECDCPTQDLILDPGYAEMPEVPA